MYLSPFDPSIPTLPVASGEDYHADEADSAYEKIGKLLGDEDREGIRRLARIGIAKKRNPPDDDKKESFSRDYLYPIAFLVTGQWGPPSGKKTFDQIVPTSSLVRRKNPKQWDKRGFFGRMEALKRAIDFAMAEAKRVKSSGWQSMLTTIGKAVEFIALQREEALMGRGSIFAENKKVLGVTFEAVASKGNQKLPFVSYSELPMSTCPGAGACAVREDQPSGEKGWCYSFRAWRMPNPFARQFLCTLANTADREFAIMAAAVATGQDPEVPSDDRERRVELALSTAGRARRVWPQFIKVQAFRVLQKSLMQGSVGFMRLFVDGDINTEDNIVEWMDMCRDLDKDGEDIAAFTAYVNEKIQKARLSGKASKAFDGAVSYLEKSGSSESLPGVEVYGYSKCWQQFVNVNELYAASQVAWPRNYTLNMSNGSVYAKSPQVRDAMLNLPITRGYFEAIPLDSYIQNLRGVYDKKTDSLTKSIKPISSKQLPFDFSEQRVKAFARMNEMLEAKKQSEITSKEQALEEVRRLASVANQILRDEGACGSYESPINSELKSKAVAKIVFLKDVAEFYETNEIVLAAKATIAEGLKNAQASEGKADPPDEKSALRINYEYTVSQIRKKTFEFYFYSLTKLKPSTDGSVNFSEGVRRQFMLDYAGGKWDESAEARFIRAWAAESRENFVKAIADVTKSESGSTLGAVIAMSEGRIKDLKKLKSVEREKRGADLTDKQIDLAIDELEQVIEAADQKASAEARAVAAAMRKGIELTPDQKDSVMATAMTESAMTKKAIAWGLHEVFIALSDVDGSCPLVCGNCSDASDPTEQGVHRCASKTSFKGKVINIGLH